MGLLQYLVHSINSKIGNSTNNWSTDKTVLGYANTTYQHFYNGINCYPALANGVLLSTGNGAWLLGNAIEIIPKNVINKSYVIHSIILEDSNAADIYEVVLLSGDIGAEVEIARIRAPKTGTNTGADVIQIKTNPINANARLSAKIASKSLGIDTLTVSVYYYTFN